MTLTRLTKHQKATRGHVCCSRSEMNEWPLQSFTCFWNHLNHYKKVDSEFWGKPVQYFKCTRFLWEKKDRNRLHVMWGSDIFFFFCITKSKSCI